MIAFPARELVCCSDKNRTELNSLGELAKIWAFGSSAIRRRLSHWKPRSGGGENSREQDHNRNDNIMAQTYSSYLKVNQLLELQEPLSDGPEHDEMLFIVIHQVYELWFKQILHEADRLKDLFSNGEGGRAQHTLGRIRSILKVMVSQLDVLETMTPLEFNSFRARLETASGFQSFQFRELEFLLGLKSMEAVERFPSGSPARQRLKKRMEESCLWDFFLQFLRRRGYEFDANEKAVYEGKPGDPLTSVQRVLIDIYRNNSEVAQVAESLLDLDEGLQEWRYRHVKMVQRTIGMKMGSGGSTGVEYLRTTLDRPVFPDLWVIRSQF